MASASDSTSDDTEPRCRLGITLPPADGTTSATDGGESSSSLPLRVVVMADLDPNDPQRLLPLAERTRHAVDRANLDSVLEKFSPKYEFATLSAVGNGADSVPIESMPHEVVQFKKIDDFCPDRLLHIIPTLRLLRERRDVLAKLRTQLQQNPALKRSIDAILLDPARKAELRKELAQQQTPRNVGTGKLTVEGSASSDG